MESRPSRRASTTAGRAAPGGREKDRPFWTGRSFSLPAWRCSSCTWCWRAATAATHRRAPGRGPGGAVVPVGVALLVYSPPSAASLFTSGGDLSRRTETRRPRGCSSRRWRSRAPTHSRGIRAGCSWSRWPSDSEPSFRARRPSRSLRIRRLVDAGAHHRRRRGGRTRRGVEGPRGAGTTEPGRGRSDHARRCGRGEGVRRDRRRRPRPLPRRAPGRPGRDRLVADHARDRRRRHHHGRDPDHVALAAVGLLRCGRRAGRRRARRRRDLLERAVDERRRRAGGAPPAPAA